MIRLTLGLKTTNPNNNSQGFSRNATFAAARIRKQQRHTTCMMVRPQWTGSGMSLPVKVTVIRIAPSAGLDPIDGLGAALKSVIDGCADALGCKNDRTPDITWVVDQRRGARGYFGVEITIEQREAA